MSVSADLIIYVGLIIYYDLTCNTGKEFTVRAKCVINATGPYTDFVRQLDNSATTKICQPSSGVHIVLPDYYRYDSGKFKMSSTIKSDERRSFPNRRS